MHIPIIGFPGFIKHTVFSQLNITRIKQCTLNFFPILLWCSQTQEKKLTQFKGQLSIPCLKFSVFLSAELRMCFDFKSPSFYCQTGEEVLCCELEEKALQNSSYSQSSHVHFCCSFQARFLSARVRAAENSEISLKFEEFSVNRPLCSTWSLYSFSFHTFYNFITSSSVWFSLTLMNRAANLSCIISTKPLSKLWNFSLVLQVSPAPDTSLPHLNLLECTMGRYQKRGALVCPSI